MPLPDQRFVTDVEHIRGSQFLLLGDRWDQKTSVFPPELLHDVCDLINLATGDRGDVLHFHRPPHVLPARPTLGQATEQHLRNHLFARWLVVRSEVLARGGFVMQIKVGFVGMLR